MSCGNLFSGTDLSDNGTDTEENPNTKNNNNNNDDLVNSGQTAIQLTVNPNW
jgi:hypothetical protein